jgi:hypothetical protein
MAQLFEVRLAIVVDGQHRTATFEVSDLGLLGEQWRPLVKGDFVDSEMLSVVGEKTDERLTDGAGAHDVDDVHNGFLRS